MRHHLVSSCCGRPFLLIALTVFILLECSTPARAVTHFAPDLKKKLTPVPIDFDNLWFYDRDHAKVIPDLDTTWVTVVFHPKLFQVAFSSSETAANEAVLLSAARAIVDKYDEVVDYLYDPTLAEGACFIQLREGMDRGKIQGLIAQLDAEDTIAYAHPTLKRGGKTYAFFNAFQLEWKSGVGQEQKDLMLSQAAVSLDGAEAIYRVDVFRTPFLTAFNLLAEDIRVAQASPYLVEVARSIQAELAMAISGSSMGEKIPFTFRLAFSDRVHIDPGSIANISLRPVEIQKELFEVHIDPYDYVKVSAQSPIAITGWLRCYAPGDFVIPPVTIRYSCPECSGTQDRSIESQALPFRVSSLVPAKEPESSLIIPMDLIAPEYNTESFHRKALTQLLWAALFFAAGLSCIGWSIGRYYRNKQQEMRLRAQSQEDAIADRLRKLLQQEPYEPHWSYIAEASRLVRAYLVAKYRLSNAPSGGSGEVFFAAISTQVPEPLAAILRRVLTRTDEAVALEVHPMPDLDTYKAEVLQIIDFQAA